jgi:hypothetical protein
MIHVHLFCNPFFDGHTFWKEVKLRIESKPNYTCFVHDILEISNFNHWIQQYCISNTDKHIIVAHGSAIPFVSKMSKELLVHQDQIKISFVLSNGPLIDFDIIQNTYVKFPKWLQYFCVASPFSMRFLASSFAFRRLVINPYVMNSDMIVALCLPVFSDRIKIKKSIEYINTYQDLFPIEIPSCFPTLLCWGSMDVRYHMTTLTSFETQRNHVHRIDIEGGQHFHPIERPWAIADEIINWNITKQKIHTAQKN